MTASLSDRLPDRFNLGSHCSDRWVEAGHGDRPAIHHGGGVLSYRDLAELSSRIGYVLQGLGVGRGDRYLVRLPPLPEAYAALLGGLKIGAVPIPAATILQERELAHILAVGEVRVALVMDQFADPIRSVRNDAPTLDHVVCLGRPARDEISFSAAVEDASASPTAADTGVNDPAFVLFTSGTSGQPKGVAHAHRAFNVAAGNPCGRWAMGLTAEDVVLHPHDVAWSYTMGCGFLFPLAAGASVVAPGTKTDLRSVVGQIERHHPTIFPSVPTLFRKLLSQFEVDGIPDLSSLRFCMSAGEPLPAHVHDAWIKRTGVELLEHIGQGELSIFAANPPTEPSRSGSVGRALPGYRVAVLDEDGCECVDQVGDLVVAEDNPALFYEYIGMPEKFAENHRSGWYYTGDLASVDDDGYFWYVSRSDDLIKSRGYLISPWEVEETLLEHPGVSEAGVVGLPHPEKGEVVKAFVVPDPGFAPTPEHREDLRAYVKGKIAPFKAPAEVEFVSALPRTATGKLQRRQLRR
jgi:2-aminobenzoate-CoA ligase